MRHGFMAGAGRFAQFAGLTRGGRRASEDDRDEDQDEKGGKRGSRAADEDQDGDEKGRGGKRGSRAADEDQDGDEKDRGGKRGSRAADEDQDGDEKDRGGKRGSRAADEDQDGDERDRGGKRGSRAADDDQDGDERDRGGKRGSRADDDEDDDEREMHGRSAAAQARVRERARCAAIFTHPQAAQDTELACILAFETTMTRQQAIARLNKNAGTSTRRTTSSRDDYSQRRSTRNPDLGAGGEPRREGKQTASAWDQAHASVSPSRKAASGWDAAHQTAARGR